MKLDKIRGSTFILGIGAQKAGTSWLFNYLSQSKQITCSAIKELHVFDAWYRPDICKSFNLLFLKELRKSLTHKIEKNDFNFNERTKCLIARTKMIYDETAYLEYFESIINSESTHLCEITPAYSVIEADGFRKIKSLFEEVDITLKIIFLLRDPIDRYYSALRMKERKTAGKFNARDNFLKTLEYTPQCERGRYDKTITNLLSVFNKEDVYFNFYENLFKEKTIKSLVDYLEVEYVKPQFEVKINDSPSILKTDLSRKELNESRQSFASVYEFCADYFGNNLPEEWNLII